MSFQILSVVCQLRTMSKTLMKLKLSHVCFFQGKMIFFLYKYFLVFSMIENLGQQKKLVAQSKENNEFWMENIFCP